MEEKSKGKVTAIDLGKRRSYFVIDDGNGNTVREGYTPTDRQGFNDFLCDVEEGSTVIVEASNSLDRVAELLKGYELVVAHPAKVRLIAASVKKTDKNDAHTLLELYRLGYLPRSYLADAETRQKRNLCRNRDFFVRQRTAVKSRIKDQAYRKGVDVKRYSQVWMEVLRSLHDPVIDMLVGQLADFNRLIKEADRQIEEAYKTDKYAQLIDTIPGFGKYASLAVSAQIGDVSRFKDEDKLCAYAGLVPITRQSGGYEWKGRTRKGDSFLKFLVVECTHTFLRCCPDSLIGQAHKSIALRAGRWKAQIASSRKVLRTIYYMLKRGETYHLYEERRKTSADDLLHCSYRMRDASPRSNVKA